MIGKPGDIPPIRTTVIVPTAAGLASVALEKQVPKPLDASRDAASLYLFSG
jgi:hypothetical protein